ncbi:MAG: peptidylprolyl isomerase [Oricola sp.]|jgi:peptidyl-prolyl cis-trans isomerase A (cyclophilin A)|nr:peptidylprolyl isomerase [Oricola sp.]
MMRKFLACLGLTVVAACVKPAPENPRVVMETEKGEITLELYPDKAPLTVANFLRYVDEGALDGGAFYRTTRPDNDPMIAVIQGGLWKPWEEGMDEDFEPPFPPIAHETTEVSGLTHGDGVISMARDQPGTASSEFFINVGANPSLDFGGERNPDGQGFAAFGKVISGMDVVAAIHAAPAQEGESFAGQILAEPVTINSVRREP